MRISYRIYEDEPEYIATMTNTREHVAAFMFSMNDDCFISRLAGRRVKFSHLGNSSFIMHKALGGEYVLTESTTGAKCAEVCFAKNYNDAFERMIYAVQCSEVMQTAERFETALDSFMANITPKVAKLTNDPELTLFEERLRYRREAHERKECLAD